MGERTARRATSKMVPIWPFQVFPLSNAPNTILVLSINPHTPEV
jgi:hypothetical protein